MALPLIGAALTKAVTATEKIASVADKLGKSSEIGSLPNENLHHIKDVSSVGNRLELSDEALHTRVEASAHSACRFFGLPDIVVQEGDTICVYRGLDIFPDKDVFEYNLHQFKQMGCTNFEDMSKVWAHECGHRLLRLDFSSPWAQELGADFFAGVRSQMLGLPSGNFEKFLGKTSGSLSHPSGDLRLQAIKYGRDVVKNMLANGQTPTLESCKAAFENSPFAKMKPIRRVSQESAAFVDSKSYHYGEAAKAKENANYYSKQAEKAANNGDFSKAKDYSRKAESYANKAKDENSAAERSSKLVDNPSLKLETKETKLANGESSPVLEQNTRTELTKEDRVKLKERTGWSDAIVDAIRTKEEAEIYENAGLVEGEVNGKPALLQPDIKGDACNSRKYPGWSNRDLAGEGYAPCDKSGMPYELHHIGQNPDSPLAELTHEQHHKNGNFKKLHTFDETKVHGEGNNWDKERAEYWMNRSKSL